MNRLCEDHCFLSPLKAECRHCCCSGFVCCPHYLESALVVEIAVTALEHSGDNDCEHQVSRSQSRPLIENLPL